MIEAFKRMKRSCGSISHLSEPRWSKRSFPGQSLALGSNEVEYVLKGNFIKWIPNFISRFLHSFWGLNRHWDGQSLVLDATFLSKLRIGGIPNCNTQANCHHRRRMQMTAATYFDPNRTSTAASTAAQIRQILHLCCLWKMGLKTPNRWKRSSDLESLATSANNVEYCAQCLVRSHRAEVRPLLKKCTQTSSSVIRLLTWKLFPEGTYIAQESIA